VFTFLVIWLTHGWLYRWPRTRIADAAVERALERLRCTRSPDGA
jgi:lipid A 4'-phosphatase